MKYSPTFEADCHSLWIDPLGLSRGDYDQVPQPEPIRELFTDNEDCREKMEDNENDNELK